MYASTAAISARLEGHTDDRGTSEYNLGLGMRRAEAVREYILNAGIASSRLITVTFGEEMPLRRGGEETAYQKNRRVEFGTVNGTAQATAQR